MNYSVLKLLTVVVVSVSWLPGFQAVPSYSSANHELASLQQNICKDFECTYLLECDATRPAYCTEEASMRDTQLSVKAQQDICAIYPNTNLPWCKAVTANYELVKLQQNLCKDFECTYLRECDATRPAHCTEAASMRDTQLSVKAQQDICAIYPNTNLPWCKAVTANYELVKQQQNLCEDFECTYLRQCDATRPAHCTEAASIRDTHLSVKAQQDICAIYPNTNLPWCKAVAEAKEFRVPNGYGSHTSPAQPLKRRIVSCDITIPAGDYRDDEQLKQELEQVLSSN